MIQGKIPTAREWMSEVKLKLRADDPILDAIRKMTELKIAGAPVVDAQETFLGLLTEKDCLRFVTRTAYDNNAENGVVADYMSRSVTPLDPSMDLFRVSEIFLENNFPSLPVIEDGRLIGRMKRFDVLHCMEAFISSREQIRAQEMRQHEEATQRPRGIAAMQQSAAKNSPRGLARLFSRNR